MAGAGPSSTDAICFGASPPPISAQTELWNGTNWTETTDLSTGRHSMAGNGTSSNALAIGSNASPQAIVEEWTGAGQPVGAWSTANSLNTARSAFTGNGTTSAGIVFGGVENPNTYLGATETYNGTNWTEVNDLNQVRYYLAAGSAAPQTAAIAFGGGRSGPDAVYANTATWNGSNWTEVNDLNTARDTGGSIGTATSALFAGGFIPPFSGKTEEWNGVSWVEVADINTTRGYKPGNMGTTASGLIAGGQTAPGGTNITGVTEEWSSTSNTVKTLTD